MADNKSLHVNHRTPPDYVAIEQELWRRAHQKVRTEAKDRGERLMKRLESFVRCFGFAEREVLDKIQNDDMFAACFAKILLERHSMKK